MGSEKKIVLLTVLVVAVCLTVLCVLLFVSLWAYKEWVGISLLALLAALVYVYIRGKLNEQDLRRIRYRHYEETPLDMQGEPSYWHLDAQVNPHRRWWPHTYEQDQYGEYQAQGSRKTYR